MKPIVVRGSEKIVIMEVVSQEGKIVDEYKDSGNDKLPYQFITERVTL